MNHLSHDYQLPDDSFLYNLDVNDWSMLAHPEGTDQSDDDRGVDEESGWLSQSDSRIRRLKRWLLSQSAKYLAMTGNS